MLTSKHIETAALQCWLHMHCTLHGTFQDWEEDKIRAKIQDEEAAAFAAASSGTNGSSSNGNGGKGRGAPKRKGLGFYEQQEYKKIQKHVEQLTAQRDALQERVITLAAGGKDQVGRSWRISGAWLSLAAIRWPPLLVVERGSPDEAGR